MMFTNRRKWRREDGQMNILLVLMLGIFFLGFVGFAVDYSNFWFHRRAAQAAADAACQAGAMDLLVNATNGTTLGNFPNTTGFDCATAGTATPCAYATLNGYPSATITPGTPGTDVTVSFPSTVPGAKPPPGSLAPVPFMQVNVHDSVQTFFSGLITGKKAQDVGAMAACGLVLAKSPIPIIVLNPTISQALLLNGNPTVAISGGPQRSIQVNSNNATAIVNKGSKALIDLHLGGPNGTGSDLGVFGGPTTEPPIGQFNPGTTGTWLAPSPPIGDPFAQMAAPSITGVLAGIKTKVASGVNGCPAPAGTQCTEYTAGTYSNIQIKAAGSDSGIAIFDPGIYFVSGSLSLDSNSIVRPSTATGDGTGGVMFYFSGNSTPISVAANSGSRTLAKDGIAQFTVSSANCPGGIPLKSLPAAVDGNVLLGPCSGTYGDPLGQYRGMLFFQNRSTDAVTVNWGGGGSLLSVGNIYVHKCNGSGTGTGCLAPTSGYDDILSLQGGSGSGTYILGEIVTDQLNLGGVSTITMTLDPNQAFNILKAELLQ